MFHAAGFGWRLARPSAGFLFGNEGETSLAIVFPVAFPSTPAPRSVVWRPQSVVARTESPFSLSQQIQAHQGQRWVVEMDFPPMTRAQAEEFTAFILSLNGMEGTFLLPPFGGKTARGVPVGSPQLEILSGSKATPTVAGWTPNVSGLLKKGDFLQFSKNYLTFPKAFDNAAWVKAGTPSVPVVTPNSIVAPTGLTTAESIAFPATAGGEENLITQLVTPSPATIPSQTWESGVWLKAPSAQSIRQVLRDDPASGENVTVDHSVTTAWTLFKVQKTFASTSNSGFHLSLRNIASQAAKTIHAWGAYLSTPQENTLHKSLNNENSNSSGIGAHEIWPALRHFNDSSPVAFSNMTGVFRLAQNENPWDINTAMHFGISLVAMEAVP